MSKYAYTRRNPSPYSALTSGPPTITKDDYSYITSRELDEPIHDRRRHQVNIHTLPNPEDDILLLKNRGITYPIHFPAYTIGDGRLQVRDVKNRVGLVMNLDERTLERVKLTYKGCGLEHASTPVREYGVKNKSEITAVVPRRFEGSASDGETVVVREPDSGKKTRGRKGKKIKEEAAHRAGKDSADRHHDSRSMFDPPDYTPADRPGASSLKKLDELAAEFTTKWLPLCVQFTASIRKDAEKREDEHRKISESMLQQIILRLDEVQTDGIDEVKTRRKALVREVQEALKAIDAAKASLSYRYD
ncbi:BAG domain protein [Emericellopsis atlantica]|uniref:BAG domain protein n=1 Tax=Emericellopsis atlantica TaxID=2614577 RepID=A0A9P7ZD88_9HYPO|nr:BAG domain protein [Emericellopsis atlantica]KAG9249964.1 BAG domain protein [Emericellopsis atlantica]